MSPQSLPLGLAFRYSSLPLTIKLCLQCNLQTSTHGKLLTALATNIIGAEEFNQQLGCPAHLQKQNPEHQVEMKLTLQTVICCCIFTIVLPLVRGATAEPNATLKKRYRVWPQNHMKRDLPHSTAANNVQFSEIPNGPAQDSGPVPIPLRFQLKLRPKRSPSKQSGCHFITCIYHDMAHKVHIMSQPKDTAPEKKLGPKGYGRRRRSLADNTQLALLSEKQERCSEVDP